MQISINGKLTVNIDELTLDATELEHTILTALNNESPVCVKYLSPVYCSLTDAHLYTDAMNIPVEEDLGNVLVGLTMLGVKEFRLETSSKSLHLEVR